MSEQIVAEHLCACPVISAFLRSWNDALPDEERNVLLRPLIPRLAGTRGAPDLERRRAIMAADWLVRTQTPAWLRLAGLTAHAEALAALPEIADFLQCPSLMPVLEAARADVAAAWEAPGIAAARATATTADWDAAIAAPWDTAMGAAWIAVRAAATPSAIAAARVATKIATGAVGWGAIEDTAKDALSTTRIELQQSALKLIERMLKEGS